MEQFEKNDGTGSYGPSKKSALIGVFLVLIAVTGYVFFSKSLAENVSVIKADVTAKAGRVEELKTSIQEYDKAEEDLQVGTEVQRLESLKSIPLDMDQDEVIRDLIDIADSYDIGLKSLSFGKGSVNKEGVKTLSVNSSFEGNYNDLLGFLEGIEQNGRLFRVGSISVQINKVELSDVVRVTFSLSMEAFFQE